MREFKDVVEGLSRLDQHGIYQILKFNGIKGRRADGRHCPIANYIKKETGAETMHVGTCIVLNHVPGMSPFAGPKAPQSVKDFIQTFDSGIDFTDLNEENA